MGVRALDDAAWLVVDDRFDRKLHEKEAANDSNLHPVNAARPGTEKAGRLTLGLVRDWIAAHGSAEAQARALASGSAPDAAVHPLLRAALLVQEDLCVMVPSDGGYVLAAAAVHFASHWRLADKMGLPMARIHAPVRHYADELEQRADRFFDRLAEGRIMVRRNVSIHDHDDLFRPEPPETYEDFDGDFDALWIRSERQTLRRLGDTGAVLFTIKTQQCPLPSVLALPEVAGGLAAKLRAIRADHEAAGLPVHAPAGIAEWLEAAPRPG
jgi:hypothetical protein